MKIISLSNQKGGCGKTTTAQALASGLARRGRSVLAIDGDPQCNFGFGLNIPDPEDGKTLHEVLQGKVSIDDCIIPVLTGFDILPGSIILTGADMEFITRTHREYMLQEALRGLQRQYDYCIIDSPPSLGILTMNILTASDGVIVPVDCGAYSVQGLSQLVGFIQNVRQYCNPGLKITGILLTKYRSGRIVSRQIREGLLPVAEQLQTELFDTTIRDAAAIGKAQFMQQDIFSAFPKEDVTADYLRFIDEFLDKTEGRG